MIFGKRQPDAGPLWRFAWRPFLLADTGGGGGWIWLEYAWKARIDPHPSVPNATVMFRGLGEARRCHVGWDC